MTTLDLYKTYLWNCLLVLCCCLSLTTQAQQGNDGLLAGKEKNDKPAVVKPTPQRPVYRATPKKAKHLLDHDLSASFNIHKITPKAPSTTFDPRKAKAIERSFYVDNIFAIGESDNPFALRRTSYGRTKKPDNENEGKAFKELVSEIFYGTAPTNIQKNDSSPPQWLIFVMLSVLGLLAIVLSIYKQEVKKTFQAFANSTSAGQAYREQKDFFTPAGFSVYGLFCLGAGVLAFLTAQKFAPETINLNTFFVLMACVLGVGGIYMAKHLQLKLISLIFPFQQEADYYNFLVSNTNRILGFALVPFVFLAAYSPAAFQDIALYSSFGVVALAHLYRGFRGVSATSDIILFHKFHFFIYLCTVEIAPVLILLKLLTII